jgi:branched-chain amino acid transport system substrate-binding protein
MSRLSGLCGIVIALMLACGARAADPIQIGFCMSLTGPFAVSGKQALIAMKIWEEDVNAKGGLLGRPVKLDYYDDQSNPANVPGIYTKLLDVDKVELVVGPYGTVMTAPAMPVVMGHNMVLISLVSLGINNEFHYKRYFSPTPLGPHPTLAFSKGLFEVAMRQRDKPQTIAIVAADQEFSKNNADGARTNAKEAGLKILYDKTYPPSTTDFTPIVRAIQATKPDIFYVASYPPDSVGIVRARSEVGFTPKLMGGAMVGLQITTLKMQLGPLLNGIVTFEPWLPVKTMMFPGVMDLIKRYQAQAPAQGADPLGYFLAPPAYAYLQILAQAVARTSSLDQDKIAAYIHGNTFDTVDGTFKFEADGETAVPRQFQVQFHGVTGNGLDQFVDGARETILDPPNYKTGELIYPYANALK